MSNVVERFDVAADALIDRFRGVPVFDRLFYTASAVADYSTLWHLLGVSQGLSRPDGFARALRLTLALGAESAIVNGAIKSLVRRRRPVVVVDRPHRLRIPVTSSFPSGHASSAFMAATLLSDDARGAPLYFALAAVVAVSRMHVRIHHASDVAAGAALGLALGAIAKRIYPFSE